MYVGIRNKLVQLTRNVYNGTLGLDVYLLLNLVLYFQNTVTS